MVTQTQVIYQLFHKTDEKQESNSADKTIKEMIQVDIIFELVRKDRKKYNTFRIYSRLFQSSLVRYHFRNRILLLKKSCVILKNLFCPRFSCLSAIQTK